MLNASVPAELYWNSWRQTGWHRQKMTSRQEPTNKKGFSVERQTKNSTFVTRDATIIGPQMLVKILHLWQKAGQNKEKDDEWGNHTSAHTSRVEKHLTPSHKGGQMQLAWQNSYTVQS